MQKIVRWGVRLSLQIKVGAKVAIKNVSVEVAKAAQQGHGGWSTTMDNMLGKTGEVESIDKDGDVKVKMDIGTMLWNPVLVLPSSAGSSPFTSVSSAMSE